jgi:type IV pilus assembly protein PilM
MEILPKTLGTRPRLAVEIRWGGVVAARAADASTGVLNAVSRAELAGDAVEPGLKPGNFKRRPEVVAAVKKTLDAVTEKGLGREVSLIVPDATVRVLLLDFDTLPVKAAEALPVVRFRLKKLLPFDADGAVVSYQIMSGSPGAARGGLRVVAVAIPREVLEEYEAVVRDAGYEPGAVLPGTLAAIAGLPEDEAATLVVNAGPQAITTAIVENGVLLLHRSVDMSGNVQVGILAEATVMMTDVREGSVNVPLLPLIDVEGSQEEWAMQEAVDPFARDQVTKEALARGGIARAAVVHDFYGTELNGSQPKEGDYLRAAIEAELLAEAQAEAGRTAHGYAGSSHGYVREVTQAVSVAAAYFEDTLERGPETVLSAGSTSAKSLSEMLAQAGFGELVEGGSRTRVKEMVDSDALAAQAVSASVPRGWLSGVRGALRS